MASKVVLLALCCLASLGLLLLPLQPVTAQAKKKGGELAKARQRIEQLERVLKEKENRIDQLQAQLKKEKRDDRKDDNKIQQLLRQLKDKDKKIVQLQADLKLKTSDDKRGAKEWSELRSRFKELETLKQSALVHTVIYRLKANVAEDQVQVLIDDAAKTLKKVSVVRGFWVGRPSGSTTADQGANPFQVGLVVLLDNADALAILLNDGPYRKLAERLKKNWEPPTVYNFRRE